MKARLNELDGGLDDVDKSPPRKRACTRKSSTQKKGKGKENKTPQSAKRKVNKQQGRILLVGAKPQKLSEVSADSQDQPLSSEHKQSGDQPSTSQESGDQASASQESGDQPSTSKQSGNQRSASQESGDQPSASKQSSSQAEATELQPMQPEDTCIIVSSRGGSSNFINLSPYDSMEDDIGKNSLFLYTCTFNIEVATISILQLLYPVLLVL